MHGGVSPVIQQAIDHVGKSDVQRHTIDHTHSASYLLPVSGAAA